MKRDYKSALVVGGLAGYHPDPKVMELAGKIKGLTGGPVGVVQNIAMVSAYEKARAGESKK